MWEKKIVNISISIVQLSNELWVRLETIEKENLLWQQKRMFICICHTYVWDTVSEVVIEITYFIYFIYFVILLCVLRNTFMSGIVKLFQIRFTSDNEVVNNLITVDRAWWLYRPSLKPYTCKCFFSFQSRLPILIPQKSVWKTISLSTILLWQLFGSSLL